MEMIDLLHKFVKAEQFGDWAVHLKQHLGVYQHFQEGRLHVNQCLDLGLVIISPKTFF